MGPQSPSKHVADGTDGLFLIFWMGIFRQRRDPSSSRESANSQGPPDRQRVILDRLGRFILRNLVLKPCDHTIGSRTLVLEREQQCQ